MLNGMDWSVNVSNEVIAEAVDKLLDFLWRMSCRPHTFAGRTIADKASAWRCIKCFAAQRHAIGVYHIYVHKAPQGMLLFYLYACSFTIRFVGIDAEISFVTGGEVA